MANRLDSSNVDTIIDNIIIHRKCNERNILRVIALLCITVCYFVIFQQQLPDVSIALTGEISTNHDLNSKESKKDDGASVPRTLTWPNWPAVAYEELNHPLVFKGDSFVHRSRDLLLTAPNPTKRNRTLLDEFIEIYDARPDKINMCGIRINHALALFLTVRQIKPTLVVESGVNAGVSTYFIRAASADTRIYALDPLAKPICKQGTRWMDKSNKTTYFTGDKFVDLADFNWREMTANGEMIPDSTLVFIDDHLHVIKRIPALIKSGIRHVLVEDNYKINEGATPMDKVGTPKQAFHADTTKTKLRPLLQNYLRYQKKDAIWLFPNLVSYAEFPPIVPPIMSKEYSGERKPAGGFMHANDKNDDIVAPILRPDLDPADMKIFEGITKTLNLDVKMVDVNSYMQFMNYNQIVYMELLHMPSHLVEKF